MGCTDLLVKYFLIWISVLATLSSIVQIFIGLVLLLFTKTLLNNIDSIFHPIVTIVCGCLLFLAAHFGCCGVLAKRSCLLFTYAICMAIITANSIYVFVTMLREVKTLDVTMGIILNDFWTNSRETFNVLEVLLTCCGTTGPEVYLDQGLDLPITCCPNIALTNISAINTEVPDLNQLCTEEDASSGCNQFFIDLSLVASKIIIYIILAEICMKILGILFAFFLGCRRKTNNKTTDDNTVRLNNNDLLLYQRNLNKGFVY